jgi:O-antigen ligase
MSHTRLIHHHFSSTFLSIAIPAHVAIGVCLFGGTPPWATALLQWSICAMGSVFAIQMLRTPRPLRKSSLLIPLALAPLWGVLQLLFNTSAYRFATLDAIVTWFCYSALFAVALQEFGSSQPALLRTLRFLPLFGMVVAVWGLLEHFSSPATIFWFVEIKHGSPFGPFVDRDHFAVFAELLLPLAIWNAFESPRRAVLYTAAAGSLFAAVIASGSRAGAAMVALEVMLCLSIAFFRIRAVRHFRQIAPKVIACVVLFSAIAGWSLLWSRVSGGTDPFANRREMFESAMRMVREKPWMGFGLGTFQFVYPAYAVTDFGLFVDHAHNDWAEWAAEGGVPFVLLIVSALALVFRSAFRSIWGLGILAAFIHALVDFPMQIPALASIAMVLLAALACESKTIKEPERVESIVLVLEKQPAVRSVPAVRSA